MYYVIQHVIRKVLVTCCTRATWCSWWIWKGPFGSRFCEGFRHVKHYRCREDEFLNESTSPGRVYPPGCQSPTRIVIFSRGISIKKRLHLPLLDAESIRQVYGKYVETTRSFHLQNNWGVKNMQLISPIRGWNHDLITRMSFRHQSPRVVCPFWKAKFTNWALNFASQYRVVCCWRFFQLEQFVVFFWVVENQSWFSLEMKNRQKQAHVFGVKILQEGGPNKFLGIRSPFSRYQNNKNPHQRCVRALRDERQEARETRESKWSLDRSDIWQSLEKLNLVEFGMLCTCSWSLQ